MQVKINNRGNGACPLCRHDGKCPYQKRIKNALADVKSSEDFQLVIYTCPHFKERI